jgi:hypothetical protein
MDDTINVSFVTLTTYFFSPWHLAENPTTEESIEAGRRYPGANVAAGTRSRASIRWLVTNRRRLGLEG